ncbi:MAG: hypothetical protein ABIJ37_11130 [Pseudomonadota bacterium]
MGIMVVIIVTGICTLSSLYLAYLAFRIGGNEAFLFAGFGLLFAIPFISSMVKALSKKSILKTESESVRFVPHWFMMTAIIITGLIIIASIAISIIKAVR